MVLSTQQAPSQSLNRCGVAATRTAAAPPDSLSGEKRTPLHQPCLRDATHSAQLRDIRQCGPTACVKNTNWLCLPSVTKNTDTSFPLFLFWMYIRRKQQAAINSSSASSICWLLVHYQLFWKAFYRLEMKTPLTIVFLGAFSVPELANR
jgi:hypothetical protein